MNIDTVSVETSQLIKAIRIGYCAAGMLPDGWEWVRWLRRAWLAADRDACIDLLGYLATELGDIEGAWGIWSELRRATPTK